MGRVPEGASAGRSLCAEVGENGVDALIREGALGQCELLEDVSRVRLYRLGRDVEALGDAAVGEPFSHEGEDFAFAGGELVERVGRPAPVEQLGDEGGIDDDATREDARDRFGQLRWVEDAVLEEVPNRALSPFEQPKRVFGLDVLGEDE